MTNDQRTTETLQLLNSIFGSSGDMGGGVSFWSNQEGWMMLQRLRNMSPQLGPLESPRVQPGTPPVYPLLDALAKRMGGKWKLLCRRCTSLYVLQLWSRGSVEVCRFDSCSACSCAENEMLNATQVPVCWLAPPTAALLLSVCGVDRAVGKRCWYDSVFPATEIWFQWSFVPPAPCSSSDEDYRLVLGR